MRVSTPRLTEAQVLLLQSLRLAGKRRELQNATNAL